MTATLWLSRNDSTLCVERRKYTLMFIMIEGILQNMKLKTSVMKNMNMLIGSIT